MKMTRLTHLNSHGEARMVDVSSKKTTVRRAVAEARVSASRAAIAAVKEGRAAKGDVESIVRIAAIAAAKKTPDLIPLCHAIPLEHCSADVELHDAAAVIRVVTTTSAKTGVEMEAMTAAAVGALTFYDMIKGIDRAATIESIRLLKKEGGKSGIYVRKDIRKK